MDFFFPYLYYFSHKGNQSDSEGKYSFFRLNYAAGLLLLPCFFLEKAGKIIQTESKIVSHAYLVWSATQKISNLVDNTRSFQEFSRLQDKIQISLSMNQKSELPSCYWM